MPDRPPPINSPKILNAAIMSERENTSVNNIVMGRPFAGSVFLPALGMASFVVFVLFRVKWVKLRRDSRKNR